MKQTHLLLVLSIMLAVIGASVSTYVMWPDQSEPVKTTDKNCKRDASLFCHNEVTDNVPLEGEKGYKTEPKAFILSDRVFNYSIETRGAVSTDIEDFAMKVSESLSDSRGWSQIATFQRSKSGEFTIVLSQASLLPSFSSACSSQWSCRSGNYVIINEARWLGASPSWNSGGGSLRDYQHMVVNHEVGHWLGHGHVSCSGKGALAPVMQQQSINLQGCVHNPWPLESELSVLR